MNEEYLTVKQVAVKLGVKQVTAYKWIREGKLKGTYLKIGGVYRFSEKLLTEMIDRKINNA
jgi:excisionase family DNA binding protein